MRPIAFALAVATARGLRQRVEVDGDLSQSRSTDCTAANVRHGEALYVICRPGDESVIAEALGTPSMHVHLMDGAYEIDTWQMAEGTTLEGSGIEKTIIHKAPLGSKRPLIRSGGSSPRIVTLKGGKKGEEYVPPSAGMMTTGGLTIRSLTVDGHHKVASHHAKSLHGIDIRNVVGLHMESVGVRNVKRAGISIRGSHKAGSQPLAKDDTPRYECRDIMMDKLHLQNIGGHGILFLDFCTNVVVQNSKLRNINKAGINCGNCQSYSGTHRSRIYNNEITFDKASISDVGHPTRYAGIRLSNNAKLIDVEGNTIANMSRGIFAVAGCSYNNIGDNTIVGPQRAPNIYRKGRALTSQGMIIQTPFNNVFCNTVKGADFSGIRLDGWHSSEARREMGFPAHNDQNVFSHNLVENEGRIKLVGKGEGGIRVTRKGTALGQKKKTFGNVVKYTAKDKSQFDSESGAWCKQTFVERAQSLVAVRGLGPPLL